MFLTSTLEVIGQLHNPPTLTPFPPCRERPPHPQSLHVLEKKKPSYPCKNQIPLLSNPADCKSNCVVIYVERK